MLGNMRALDWFLGTAALVSLIGGLLLGYQWGQPADASIVKALPASLEMMQLLRDEPLGREYARIATEKKLAYGEASN
jgi:hypothetical protein